MDNLLLKRRKLRVSQAELSTAVGISETTLSKYEREITEPRISTLNKMWEYLEEVSEIKNSQDQDQ